jgi:uncharacterized phage protein (TIGR01671 family)
MESERSVTMMQIDNDRFKFRVWDELINEYRKEGTIQLSGNGQPFIIDGNMQPQDIDNVIIEQCTGLKDKNGKLIYEGDVVKQVFKDGLSTYKEVYYDSVMCRWYLRRCSPGLHSTRQYLFGDFNSSAADKLEIIGNIHAMESKK